MSHRSHDAVLKDPPSPTSSCRQSIVDEENMVSSSNILWHPYSMAPEYLVDMLDLCKYGYTVLNRSFHASLDSTEA
ncbi:hypothetical protein PG996_000146 [Apiospora saccharicola]|uniref:Uncharacterized protein n=1 Tax=Apiospora saccharicola TaxID=335842 RepID=A0ABR1WFW7_9PEZI